MLVRLLAPLRNAPFRWLTISSVFSLVSDMVYAVVLPWLALQLGGYGAVVGSVLALWALPRAFFTLFGGALSDRYNPRTIMIASSIGSALVNLLAALLLASGGMQLWMLYGGALLLGVIDSLHAPAASTITPRTVQPEQLNSANGLLYMIFNGAFFVGPLLGGGLSAQALYLPFGLSAAMSVAAVVALLRVQVAPLDASAQPSSESTSVASNREGFGGILREIGAGLAYVWRTPALKGVMVLLGGFNLLIMGPYQVGLSLLAEERLGGAAAFGAVYAAFGIGGVVGALMAAVLPPTRLNLLILVSTLLLGAATAIMGLLYNLPITLILVLIVGISGGLYEPRLTTWLQEAPPEHMRGRLMGTISLLAVGIEPISHAAAGFIGDWSVTGLYIGAGVLIVLLALWFSTTPSAQALAERRTTAQTGEPKSTAAGEHTRAPA